MPHTISNTHVNDIGDNFTETLILVAPTFQVTALVSASTKEEVATRADFVARNWKYHDVLVTALQGLLLECSNDVINPCWDNRPGDLIGKHWGGGKACPQCFARAALTAREQQAVRIGEFTISEHPDVPYKV